MKYIVTIFGLVLAVSCNQEGGDSALSDAATTSSYKTGFFKPKTKAEYQLVGKSKPISVKEFLNRAKRAAGQDLKLKALGEGAYATATNGASEQLLLLITDVDVPMPVASLQSGKLFGWHQKVSSAKSKMVYQELFIKSPYGVTLKDFTPKDMYVRRAAYNDSGVQETVLVPWLQHVGSERGKSISFRIGNTILDARTGKAVLEFEQLEANKPAWIMVGSYDDGEIRNGTVFWRENNGNYYSMTPNSEVVTHWKDQDGDSLDRVGPAATNSYKVPNQVTAGLKRGSSQPKNTALKSFDSYLGDSHVFQLNRNSMTFSSSTAGSSFALSSESNEGFTEDDYTAQGYSLGFWSSNKPVKTHNLPNGNKGTVYTDQNGKQHGGVMLSSRNVWIPGGMFSRGKYEKRHYIANRTNDTVSEVRADGTVVKSGMSYSSFKGRVKTTNNMRQLQREGGSDASVQRKATQLSQRSSKQLARSESLLGGNSVSEMAGGIAERTAVGQLTAQAAYGRSPLESAGVWTASNAAMQVRKGSSLEDGYKSVSHGLLVGSGKSVSSSTASKSVSQAVWAAGKKSATESKQIGAAAGSTVTGAFDVGNAIYSRTSQGDYNQEDPDYFFNSSVSNAAIAGAGVKNGASYVVGAQMGPSSSRLKTAASYGAKQTVGTLFDSTESLSRASYANTLEKERSNLLETPLQQGRDARAGNEAVGILDTINDDQPSSSTPSSSNPGSSFD